MIWQEAKEPPPPKNQFKGNLQNADRKSLQEYQCILPWPLRRESYRMEKIQHFPFKESVSNVWLSSHMFVATAIPARSSTGCVTQSQSEIILPSNTIILTVIQFFYVINEKSLCLIYINIFYNLFITYSYWYGFIKLVCPWKSIKKTEKHVLPSIENIYLQRISK